MKSRLWKIALVAGMLSFALCLAGCGTQGKTDSGDGYTITNQRIEEVDGQNTLVGTAKNTSGRTETLLIGWKLFDENANEVGTAVATVEDIENDGSMDFEAVMIPDFDALEASGNSSDIADLLGMEYVETFELQSVSFLKSYNEAMQKEIDRLKSR